MHTREGFPASVRLKYLHFLPVCWGISNSWILRVNSCKETARLATTSMRAPSTTYVFKSWARIWHQLYLNIFSVQNVNTAELLLYVGSRFLIVADKNSLVQIRLLFDKWTWWRTDDGWWLRHKNIASGHDTWNTEPALPKNISRILIHE